MRKAIEPTRASVKALAEQVPADTPVVMLNLLRFRDTAAYALEREEPACSGREAYAAYIRGIQPHLEAVEARVLWQASAHCAVIAPEGEEWDEMLLVEYPTVGAFLSMLQSPEYQAITVHRSAALEDSRLIATVRNSD